jgi:hypothetical protein
MGVISLANIESGMILGRDIVDRNRLVLLKAGE